MFSLRSMISKEYRTLSTSEAPVWLQFLLQAGLVGGLFSVLTLLITGRQAAASRLHERSLAQEKRDAERLYLWGEKREAVLLAFQDEVIVQRRRLEENRVRRSEAPDGSPISFEWDLQDLVQLLYRTRAFSCKETGDAAECLTQIIREGLNFSVDPEENDKAYRNAMSRWLERVNLELTGGIKNPYL